MSKTELKKRISQMREGGHTYMEIAKTLNVSVGTVRNYVDDADKGHSTTITIQLSAPAANKLRALASASNRTPEDMCQELIETHKWVR